MWHTTFVSFKQVRHISSHPRIMSNMDMVINGIQVHRVLKRIDEKRAYLDSKLVLLYGNQEHLNNKYETNSCISSRRIKNQLNTKQSFLKSILVKISRMQDPPPKSILLLHELIHSMNSIVWNHEVCSCLIKLRKIKKIG